MASWMVHLRIADRFLSLIKNILPTEFVVGNIAPDSGIPNDNWSSYTPDKKASHFKTPGDDGHHYINADLFRSKYLREDQILKYTLKEYSFYLGYYVHLLTDVLWIKHALQLCKSRSSQELLTSGGAIQSWKQDFYDLDAKFIRDNPKFRSFDIYRRAEGFKNVYLDIFAENAFDDRRSYIVSFYLNERYDLDREYSYFTENDMSSFIETAIKEIRDYIESAIVNKV